ncbi:rhomboid family intramembrane serine protease [Phycisphaerales bacterium AB-hyl4]|uniref:Rhomboid family intramembrane serine protease n=1 Tax=Natronomicrosphaera hydrolytica TaxID=3242702 RepID=A0ABV4U4L9_9BACT
MFFPIRTDRRLKRTPWVNYTLIAVNVLIFVGGFQQMGQFWLWPGEPRLWQFITYQFLHVNLWHLLGNMVFLWVFGNSVEDRLGRVGYLCFYLAGGVMAGLGHAWTEPAPVLGASGAVAAVTGAYLVLFPLTNVTIVFWMIIIYAFEVSGMVLILFRVITDVVFYFLDFGNVAYVSHLAGYAFGFVVALGLLVGRVVPREPYDLLSFIEQRRRRSEFRRLTRSGYQPWEGASGGEGDRADAALTPEAKANQQQIFELRRDVTQALAVHDLPEAARLYRDLLGIESHQVLNEQPQLDVANQLMAEGRYATAAAAYELFLKHYPGYSHREQIQLILGLIYARYLHQPDRARELLSTAARRLSGSDQQLARQVLDEVE